MLAKHVRAATRYDEVYVGLGWGLGIGVGVGVGVGVRRRDDWMLAKLRGWGWGWVRCPVRTRVGGRVLSRPPKYRDLYAN